MLSEMLLLSTKWKVTAPSWCIVNMKYFIENLLPDLEIISYFQEELEDYETYKAR